MPGTWSGIERLSQTKYQIVMIVILLCNGPWLGGKLSSFCSDLPIFVTHCTGPDTFHFLSTQGGISERLPHLHERNNL